MRFEFSELAQTIDSKSVQEDNGRAFTLVVKGDPDSKKN